MANPIDLATLFREQIGGRRNLIINGDMQVNQRGAAGSPTGAAGYQIIDRYYVGASGYEIDKKSTDVPSNTGLEYCLSHLRSGHTSGSVSQYIELPATGKAGVFWNGNKVTASCYVKGNSGDTFVINLRFSTGSGGTDGSNFTSAGGTLTLDGTWQKYENTFTVNQSVGGSDKAVRVILSFSNSTTNRETLVTGLQLEEGETATPFEHRSYGEELALCQRYYCETEASIRGFASGATQLYVNHIYWPQEMRAAPAVTVSGSPANGTVSTNPSQYGSRFIFTTTSSGAFWALSHAITADAEL